MKFNLKWIGQGGFIITMEDIKLCIDPYLSDSVENEGHFKRLVEIPVAPEALAVDMVITTHDHMDHLDEVAIRKMDQEKIMFSGPDSCIAHFKEIGIKENNIISLNRGETVKFKDCLLTGVYAKHTEDSIGVVLEYNGIKIYFVGDSLLSDELFEVRKLSPDILITCVNGKLGNMNSDEAVKLTKEIQPKVGIPTHYGMFAENTEDPYVYLNKIEANLTKGFEFKFNTEYEIESILGMDKS